MLKRLALLCVLPLFLSTSAFAQNANDFINLFGGMMQQAMRQAAQSEWRSLPPAELSCLDLNLRQRGASVDALVSHGVLPSDPRLVQLRSNCRGQVAQGPWPAAVQSFPYVVDGLALGGHVVVESEAYKQYHCTPSEKFPGFTWCHKEKTEKSKHGEVTSSNSILHSQDGTAVYVNRYIEPAFFDQNDVRGEIDRLSAKFDERAHEFQLPPREGLPNAIIAVWGKLELKPLNPADISTVALGGTVKGLLVSFLGDLQRSAKAGVPVYQLAGGAGFLWAATFDHDGRGVLRFLTIDASKISLSPQVASPSPPTPATPSFNCANATYPDEHAICSSTELSQLDTILVAGYEYVRTRYGNQYAKSINAPLFQARRACGYDAACIKERQLAAIKTFEGLGAPIAATTTPTSQVSPPVMQSPNVVQPPNPLSQPPLITPLSAQRARGEFARIISKPVACESLRQMPRDAFQGSRQGPACRTLYQCGESLLAQSRALVDFLQANSSVGAALQSSFVFVPSRPAGASEDHPYDYQLSRLKYALSQEGRFEHAFDHANESGCFLAWSVLTNVEPGPMLPAFEALANMGATVLNKARSNYQTDAAVYEQVIAFNDRYTGVEVFERTFAAYHQTAEDDDLAGMIRERPTFLKELDVARVRKEFLTQQTAKIATYQKTISDIEASIQNDALTKFLDPQTKSGIDDLRTNVEQLAQTVPAKRGDVAADLEVLGKRIRDIDVAITSARAAKGQITQIKRKLAEQEDAAKRVLDAAATEQLRPAFDDQFVTSVQALIKRFDDLRSADQQSLGEKRDEIADAMRGVNEFQQQISDAQARYDRAKKLDDERRSEIQKLLTAFKDFSGSSENRGRLSQEGLLVIDQIQAELNDLSELDGEPLLARQDYRKVLAAADQTLGKLDLLRTEIAEIAELVTELKTVTTRIDERGRQLLDAATSARLEGLIILAKTLGTAQIPLGQDERRQLADAGPNLRQLQSTVDDVMDREETRLCEQLIISKGYFVAACIARGLEISRHNVDHREAEAAAERERNSLRCSADSINRLRQMAISSATRILNSGLITPLMDFSDAITLECNKEANSITQAKHF